MKMHLFVTWRTNRYVVSAWYPAVPGEPGPRLGVVAFR